MKPITVRAPWGQEYLFGRSGTEGTTRISTSDKRGNERSFLIPTSVLEGYVIERLAEVRRDQQDRAREADDFAKTLPFNDALRHFAG